MMQPQQRHCEGGAAWLGVIRHPSTGIRLPELFLPGILTAYKARGVPGELTLSFGRETAPESVIAAPPGTWEITRGHTGTSIREYMTLGDRAARRLGVAVEIEADHMILIGSQAASLRRIAGDHAPGHVSPEQLRRSLDYYRLCIDEAAATGLVGCFTIDASDLYWFGADRLKAAEVESQFQGRFPGQVGRDLLARYGRTWRLPAYGGGHVIVSLTHPQAMRLALKFHDSLQASAELYRYCRTKLGDRPFSWEIALDETARPTTPREALFYLVEWQSLGLPCHYLGPNIGFAKRLDYTGNMAALTRRVRQQDAIVRALAGGLLSIHSGDGTNPDTNKGAGTWAAIVAGCGGDCKFKVSDQYYELLMEHLAALPEGGPGRNLYENIFDAVEAYLRDEVATNGPLVTPLLRRQIIAYDRMLRRDPTHRRHPRAEFFRFNEYLSPNLRDADGRRPWREALLRFVRGDAAFRTRFNESVEALTLRMIDGLWLAA